MTYFLVKPEVAGGWGKHTVFDQTDEGPVVHRFHYEFAGRPGDELLTSTPCFIVTEGLAYELQQRSLTGMWFDDVEVSTSDEFEELHPNAESPKYRWLRVTGSPGSDDFGTDKRRLVVSDRALEILRKHLSNAVVIPYEARQPS